MSRGGSIPVSAIAGWTDLAAGGNFYVDITDVDVLGWDIGYLVNTSGQDYRFDNLVRADPVSVPAMGRNGLFLMAGFILAAALWRMASLRKKPLAV